MGDEAGASQSSPAGLDSHERSLTPPTSVEVRADGDGSALAEGARRSASRPGPTGRRDRAVGCSCAAIGLPGCCSYPPWLVMLVAAIAPLVTILWVSFWSVDGLIWSAPSTSEAWRSVAGNPTFYRLAWSTVQHRDHCAVPGRNPRLDRRATFWLASSPTASCKRSC